MNDIKPQLIQLGLEYIEAQIIEYLTIHTESKVGDLSKELDIPRGSIHYYTSKLIDAGWIHYVESTKGKKIRLANLEYLKGNIEEKKAGIDKQIAILEEITKKIKPQELEQKQAEVTYYEGIDGLKQVHWNTLKAKKEIFVFSNINTRELVGATWYEDYIIKLNQNKITVKGIVDKSYAQEAFKGIDSRSEYYSPAPELAEKIEQRVIPLSGFLIQGKIIIYNDIVTSIAIDAEKIIASEIISTQLATSQKSIFSLVWDNTTKKDKVENYL